MIDNVGEIVLFFFGIIMYMFLILWGVFFKLNKNIGWRESGVCIFNFFVFVYISFICIVEGYENSFY